MLKSRGIQVALLLTFSRLWAASGWRPFYPIFLASHGFAPALIGTVLAANSAVSTVVTLGAGPIGRRIDPVIATAIALALGALGMALSPFVASVPIVYLPALLTGTAAGLSLPLLMATVSTEAPPDQRGVALGLRMSANQAASTTAPIVVGSLVSAFGIVVGFAASAAFCWMILGAAVVLHVRSRVSRADRKAEDGPYVVRLPGDWLAEHHALHASLLVEPDTFQMRHGSRVLGHGGDAHLERRAAAAQVFDEECAVMSASGAMTGPEPQGVRSAKPRMRSSSSSTQPSRAVWMRCERSSAEACASSASTAGRSAGDSGRRRWSNTGSTSGAPLKTTYSPSGLKPSRS